MPMRATRSGSDTYPRRATAMDKFSKHFRSAEVKDLPRERCTIGTSVSVRCGVRSPRVTRFLSHGAEALKRFLPAVLRSAYRLRRTLPPHTMRRVNSCATLHLQRLFSLTSTTNVAYVTAADGLVLTSFASIDQLTLFNRLKQADRWPTGRTGAGRTRKCLGAQSPSKRLGSGARIAHRGPTPTRSVLQSEAGYTCAVVPQRSEHQ